ncbi:hypothetical protein CDD83_1511 [Cordyceps sp. RAO-2017]|nr:hypothetical protein CDD83_1511 [Cordyceps sp. RAO-2017]
MVGVGATFARRRSGDANAVIVAEPQAGAVGPDSWAPAKEVSQSEPPMGPDNFIALIAFLRRLKGHTLLGQALLCRKQDRGRRRGRRGGCRLRRRQQLATIDLDALRVSHDDSAAVGLHRRILLAKPMSNRVLRGCIWTWMG